MVYAVLVWVLYGYDVCVCGCGPFNWKTTGTSDNRYRNPSRLQAVSLELVICLLQGIEFSVFDMLFERANSLAISSQTDDAIRRWDARNLRNAVRIFEPNADAR